MKTSMIILFLGILMSGYSQLDRDQLSLDISKAEAANLEQLKQFMWRRETVVTVDGQVKMNALSELNFNEDGTLDVRNLEAESTVKDKRGIRGQIQENAVESNMEYVGKALKMAISYTYMSKGQLIDFFSKAELTESNGIILAVAKDVQVKGDVVTFKIDSKTLLFVHKAFSSILGEDPISAEIEYGTFSSGVSHATKTVMNLAAKKAVIDSVNKDYTQNIR
jgi:hypothetical protein